MALRYQIDKGYEHFIFANSRRISDEVVESDEPMNNPHLTLLTDEPAPTTAPDPQPVKPQAEQPVPQPQVPQPQPQVQQPQQPQTEASR